MDLVSVLVGLFTAAILIHLRGAYLLAEKQQSALTRLHAYLMYWQSWIIDNDVFAIFHIGAEWNKEAAERLAKGEGAAGLIALKEEKKQTLAEIKEALEKGSTTFDIDKLKQQLARLPNNSVDHILRYNERFEESLLDGKTFLTDDDASALGPYYAHLCVDLKMHLMSLASKGIALIVSAIGSPDTFAIKDKAKELADIIWKGILVSKDVDELFKHVQKVRHKSMIRRTLENMWL